LKTGKSYLSRGNIQEIIKKKLKNKNYFENQRKADSLKTRLILDTEWEVPTEPTFSRNNSE
jgi:hypothetical protein